MGKTKWAKGAKFTAVTDGFGLPPAVRLVGETGCRCFTDAQPGRVLGDKKYDADSLDGQLRKLDIELIAAYKANHKKAQTQDRRCLRHYKHRWIIERLAAWLQNFRRIVVRYKYHSDSYLSFVHLVCIAILLRNYF